MALNKGTVANIQDYYLTHREGFYTKSFSRPMMSNFINVTATDKLMLQSASSTSVLQSRQAGHHKKGSVTLNARQLDMRGVKADQTFDTVKFSEEAYHAYLFAGNLDPKDFPFQAFVIEMIMNQMYEDFALEVLWNGVHLGAISGAPNNPSDTADGYRELLRQDIVAGSVTPYLTGQFTNANALDGIRQFVKDQLDTASKRARLHYIYCSQDTVDAYQENYEDAIGAYRHADEAYNLTRVHGTNAMLVPQDGISGSGLFMCRPDNLFVGFDGPPVINLDYESRELKVEVDWKYGMQYASTAELYVNEWI
jgi:hypothetical protein